MRYRTAALVIGTILATLAMVLTDPASKLIYGLGIGAITINTITTSLWTFGLAAILYILYKAFHDYPEADFQTLGALAKQTPEGAGLYSIANAIKTLAYALVILAAVLV